MVIGVELNDFKLKVINYDYLHQLGYADIGFGILSSESFENKDILKT